jgi:alkanesulfonate monooxygenase SsuD/methylene tetrahydromethanopterin reductase-like flavin-dependent oxidoreductase (luciferase family)
MRFSIWPSLMQPWSDVLEVATYAAATGWDGVYVADHFMGDGTSFGAEDTPTLEATAAVAALATATSQVRLGTLVLGATYRHPAVLAKWAATVDHVSGGRLTLGLGAGWQLNEHEQYGIALGSPGARLRRLDEACQVVRGLLHQERTTVAGDHYRVTEARAEPKPVQQPLPLLIGGKGDRMLELVARHADVWNMWGLAPRIAERSSALDRRCESIGREPADVARTAQALVRLTDDAAEAERFVRAAGGRAAVAGPVEAVAQAVADWAEVGVDEVIVPDFALGTGTARLDAMDAIVEAVAAFRS